MLEVKKSRDETGPQDWPTRSGLKWRGVDAVNGCPVEHVS